MEWMYAVFRLILVHALEECDAMLTIPRHEDVNPSHMEVAKAMATILRLRKSVNDVVGFQSQKLLVINQIEVAVMSVVSLQKWVHVVTMFCDTPLTLPLVVVKCSTMVAAKEMTTGSRS